MVPRVRPRYGRICAVAASSAITLLTLLAALGVVGSRPSVAAPGEPTGATGAMATLVGAATTASPADETARKAVPPAVPEASGHGRRVVFAIGQQRVWLVDGGERVIRTYLVSGSVYDNLRPGSYEVYSRSRFASGIDDSGDMQYFVRFARGERAAIGFHSIPTKDGHPVQTRGELGTPLSHGCIRQARPDARRLWHFAPVGTPVVVTA